MTEDRMKIKTGDYILIIRQKYTKLVKFATLTSTTNLGKVRKYKILIESLQKR